MSTQGAIRFNSQRPAGQVSGPAYPESAACRCLPLQKQFDAAALTLLVETLKAAKSVRPAANWGYYGYPSGCVQMSKSTDRDPIRNGKLCQAASDKLAPL